MRVMNQQGGTPTGPVPEDDWWGQLYDDTTHDTGPGAAPDSLDDRFASASGVTGEEPSGEERPGAAQGDPAVPPPATPTSRPTPPSRPVPAPRAHAGESARTPDGPRASGGSVRPARLRAPWERPSAVPSGPATF